MDTEKYKAELIKAIEQDPRQIHRRRMSGYKLLAETKRAKYYISEEGKLAKETRSKFIELGYIEDNMQLYKRLVESV